MAVVEGRTLLEAGEVAERLSMSERWVRQNTKQGAMLPYLQLGRSIRYDEHDLEAWLEGRKKNAHFQ